MCEIAKLTVISLPITKLLIINELHNSSIYFTFTLNSFYESIYGLMNGELCMSFVIGIEFKTDSSRIRF